MVFQITFFVLMIFGLKQAFLCFLLCFDQSTYVFKAFCQTAIKKNCQNGERTEKNKTAVYRKNAWQC